MRAPVCAFCLSNNVLCARDRAKLDSGEISRLDLEVSRALYRLGERRRTVSHMTVFGAKTIGETIVVLAAFDTPTPLSEVSAINRELGAVFSRRVRIVERGAHLRRVIQELAFPLRVEQVSMVWLPDGSNHVRVWVDGQVREKVRRRVAELLGQACPELLGLNVVLVHR